LSWERSKSDDVDHYVVYRATESGGNFKAVTRTKSLVYTDKGLEDGKIYYYVVTAVDSAVMRVENQPGFLCSFSIK